MKSPGHWPSRRKCDDGMESSHSKGGSKKGNRLAK